MERYGIISEKNKREIVLLRGKGCAYRKCTFCDYYDDECPKEYEAYKVNAEVLSRVRGIYGNLEVINSGSVFEIDSRTLELIRSVCLSKGISTVHFESHYMYRNSIAGLRERFKPIELKLKLGLETFDYDYRENVLRKGISERDPEKLSCGFNEANLLFGLSGQTAESMLRDIELGLRYFERLCVNIFCENTTSVLPDKGVIDEFMKKVYPKYAGDYRVDILINNTDFGVGD